MGDMILKFAKIVKLYWILKVFLKYFNEFLIIYFFDRDFFSEFIGLVSPAHIY